MTDSTETVQTHDAVDVEPHGIFLHLGKRRLRLELLLLGANTLAAGLLALPFVRFSRQGSQALMPPPAYDDARLLAHNALVYFHTGGDEGRQLALHVALAVAVDHQHLHVAVAGEVQHFLQPHPLGLGELTSLGDCGVAQAMREGWKPSHCPSVASLVAASGRDLRDGLVVLSGLAVDYNADNNAGE